MAVGRSLHHSLRKYLDSFESQDLCDKALVRTAIKEQLSHREWDHSGGYALMNFSDLANNAASR